MNFVLTILYIFPQAVYYCIEAILLSIIPRCFRKKKDISGQTILITGAGSGVGRQLAIEFSKYSTCLVLLDINKTSLLDTEKLLERCSTVFLYECDVSNREKVYEVAQKIKTDAGKVDILVNNAGIVSGKNLIDLSEEQIQKTMEVNTMAHFWTCKAFLPAMMSSNKGHIVNVASIAGFGGGPKLTDYCASKFAVVGFTESLCMELLEDGLDGIKLTLVCPSLITTGLFEGTDPPFDIVLTPEYVAQEIVAAVLEDKYLLLIPGWIRLFVLVKWIIPIKVGKLLYKACGLLNSMDTFKGRKQRNNNRPSQKTSSKTK